MTQISSDLLDSLGLSRYESQTKDTNDSLGQAEFLELLTTQLTNQDPTNPMENTDFVAQMAQFSSLTGIQELNESFSQLSQSLTQGQTLQAATLVGREVLVPGDSSTFAEGETITGAVDLSAASSNVTVGVYDAAGQLVRTLELGACDAGMREFTWDGQLADGSIATAGSTYEFRATVQGTSSTEAAETLLNARVDSISIDQKGNLQLSVEGLGAIDYADVRRIS